MLGHRMLPDCLSVVRLQIGPRFTAQLAAGGGCAVGSEYVMGFAFVFTSPFRRTTHRVVHNLTDNATLAPYNAKKTQDTG
jgi:hypothetical protein